MKTANEHRFEGRIITVGHSMAGKSTVIARLLRKLMSTQRTHHGMVTLNNVFVDKNGIWGSNDNRFEDKEIYERLYTIAEEKKKTNAHDLTSTGLEETNQRDSTQCRLSFTDLACKSVFNAIQEMFMTNRALYLLVLDISKELDSKVEDDLVYCIGTNRRMTVQGVTEYMLSLIHVYSGGQEDLFPKVLLVGTHSDMVDEVIATERMENFISSLEAPLKKLVLGKFIVDCTQEDEKEFDRMRKTIMDIVSNEPYWGEERPARWINLEMMICEMNESGRKVIPFKTIRQMNEENGAGEDELKQFLEYHNALGNLMYFGKSKLSGLVVLNPQWLADAQNMIITHHQLCLVSSDLDAHQREFAECAKLNKSLVEVIWTEYEDNSFITNMKELFIILEQAHFFARPLFYSKEGMPEPVDYYFVPSMLKQNQEGRDNIHTFLKLCVILKPSLCFVFENDFMPLTSVFSRLLTECTRIYTIKQFLKEPLFYQHAAVFQLNQTMNFVIQNIVNGIKVTIVHDNHVSMKRNLCESVRITLEDALTNIVQLYGGSRIPFYKSIQCPFITDVNCDTLMKWDDLVKFESFRCTGHVPEECHTMSRTDALGHWILNQDNTKSLTLLPCLENFANPLDHIFLGRMARRVDYKCLLLAALPGKNLHQSALENRDHMVDVTFDALREWQERVGVLTVATIHEAIQKAGSEITINQLQEAIGDTDTSSIFKDNGIVQAFLDRNVTDEAIDLISQRAAKMYKHLALELGTNWSYIDAAVRDVIGVTHRARRLLKKWRRKSKYADYKNIGCAIIEAGMDIDILSDCQALTKEKAELTMEGLENNKTRLQKQVQHLIQDGAQQNDPKIDRLRMSVFDIVRKETCTIEKTPTHWLPLEMNITKEIEKGKRLLTLDTIRRMNGNGDIDPSDDGITRFLEFENDNGVFMHFGGTSPDDIVILDPQVLVDALSQFDTKKPFISAPEGMENRSEKITKHGKLDKDLIQNVWSRCNDNTFITHKHQLLRILEKKDIIVCPVVYNKEGKSENADYYFVPSMLNQTEEERQNIEMVLQPCKGKSTPLCFVFSDNLLPPAIFPRLQVECIKIYKMKEFQKQPLLYSDAAAFQINKADLFTIENVNNVIKITIYNANGPVLNPWLCESVRLNLDDALKNIVQQYCSKNVHFEKRIQNKEDSEDMLNWNDQMKTDSVLSTDQPSIDALKPWILDQNTQVAGRRLSIKRTIPEHLEPKHFGRMARRLSCKALLLAARTSDVPLVSFEQCEFNNKDDVVGQVFDILMKWREQVSSLSILEIYEALQETGSDISMDQLEEAIADLDVGYYLKDCGEAFLEKEVSDQSLDLISQRSAKLYKHLALELGIEQSFIDTVVKDVMGVFHRTKVFLNEWRRKSKLANYRDIGCAIITADMGVSLLLDCQALVQDTVSAESDEGLDIAAVIPFIICIMAVFMYFVVTEKTI